MTKVKVFFQASNADGDADTGTRAMTLAPPPPPPRHSSRLANNDINDIQLGVKIAEGCF